MVQIEILLPELRFHLRKLVERIANVNQHVGIARLVGVIGAERRNLEDTAALFRLPPPHVVDDQTAPDPRSIRQKTGLIGENRPVTATFELLFTGLLGASSFPPALRFCPCVGDRIRGQRPGAGPSVGATPRQRLHHFLERKTAMGKQLVRVFAAIVLVLGAQTSISYAQSRGIEVPPVPAALVVPDGHVAFLKGYAIGSQNLAAARNRRDGGRTDARFPSRADDIHSTAEYRRRPRPNVRLRQEIRHWWDDALAVRRRVLLLPPKRRVTGQQ